MCSVFVDDFRNSPQEMKSTSWTCGGWTPFMYHHVRDALRVRVGFVAGGPAMGMSPIFESLKNPSGPSPMSPGSTFPAYGHPTSGCWASSLSCAGNLNSQRRLLGRSSVRSRWSQEFTPHDMAVKLFKTTSSSHRRDIAVSLAQDHDFLRDNLRSIPTMSLYVMACTLFDLRLSESEGGVDTRSRRGPSALRDHSLSLSGRPRPHNEPTRAQTHTGHGKFHGTLYTHPKRSLKWSLHRRYLETTCMVRIETNSIPTTGLSCPVYMQRSSRARVV